MLNVVRGPWIAVASLYVKAAKGCFCARFLPIVQILKSITYAESEAYGRPNPPSSANGYPIYNQIVSDALNPICTRIPGSALFVCGELSWLNLITPKALFLVPLTRFPGFAWLIAAGFALPSKIERIAQEPDERVIRGKIA